MRSFRFTTVIPENRRLLFPDEIPPGQAEIQVVVQASADAANGSLMALIEELANISGPERTKEEIDAELAHERNSWE